jgi:serine/threonine-protein kinase RsbW
MAKHTMEAVTGPDTINEIQQTLDTAFGNEEVSEYTKMCIELAVSEIGTNIIEYSGDGEPVRLRMEVDVASDTVTVTFTDDGHPAPVDLTQVTMPDEAAEGGRGLAIAFRVLDELSYTRDRDGNHWTLIRRQSE